MGGKELSVSPSPSVLLQDLMVPNDSASAVIFSNRGAGELLKKNSPPSCGKQRQVIMKQLMGLLERDLVDGGGGEDLGPETPNGSGGCGVWQGHEEVGGLGNGSDGVAGGVVNHQFQPQSQQPQQQNSPFMSLLMMQRPPNPKENDRLMEGSMWNTGACDQSSTQVLMQTTFF